MTSTSPSATSSKATKTDSSAAFDLDGFVTLPAFLTAEECNRVCREVETAAFDGAGTREILTEAWCRELAGEVRRRCAALFPADYVAVQCTLFRKSAKRNWFVARHQDLTIPVADRVADPALSGWSDKEGGLYVLPPVDLLERLVAVRVHLDDCGETNGPLRVVPGSHRLGRLEPDDIAACCGTRGEVVCAVPRGSALAMRPLLLHASSKSHGPGERRVLHFLFGPAELPYGLRWNVAV